MSATTTDDEARRAVNEIYRGMIEIVLGNQGHYWRSPRMPVIYSGHVPLMWVSYVVLPQ